MMNDDGRLRRIVVLIIVIVSSLIALSIIVAAIVHPYVASETTPEILENWGGLIIGFYFGTFVNLLKEWLSNETENLEEQG